MLFNKAAIERELGIGCGGKADLDFLEAAFDEHLKQLKFLTDVHGYGEGLIAVAQVHAAPDGRASQCAARPLTIGQEHWRKRTIFR
jgi:hypothetical protein